MHTQAYWQPPRGEEIVTTGFNWDKFSPEVQQQALQDASNGPLHLAENAGQKSAAYCLRAKEKIRAQIQKIDALRLITGFGEGVPLPTGTDAVSQYGTVADNLRTALEALSADYQTFANRFVATEMAIRAVEANNTAALKGHQISIDPHAPGMQ